MSLLMFTLLCGAVLNPECEHGELRLQDGLTPLQGRVEICVGGQWGSVCDDLWNDNDAMVACAQLGFSRDSEKH